METKQQLKARMRRWYLANKEKVKIYHKQYRIELRQFALKHYGGVCACCGESHFEFLDLDHIEGNGNTHRKKISGRTNFGGYPFLLWLKKNNWPGGFQVLCKNCNGAKAFWGQCPHVVEEQDALSLAGRC